MKILAISFWVAVALLVMYANIHGIVVGDLQFGGPQPGCVAAALHTGPCYVAH